MGDSFLGFDLGTVYPAFGLGGVRRPLLARGRLLPSVSGCGGLDDIPGLDPGPVCISGSRWVSTHVSVGCGRLCLRSRCRNVRLRGVRRGGSALGAAVPAGLFLLQETFDPPCRPPCPASGSILDPVAAVVIGPPSLGSVPKLAPQALGPVLQTMADEGFRRGLDFLLRALLLNSLFLYFFDASSPPT